MSFEKARNIIDLYIKLSGRYVGLSIEDVETDYGVSRRTAQRMLHLAEEMFGAESRIDEEGRKRWRIKDKSYQELIDITAEDLAALDLACKLLDRRGQTHELVHLRGLKNKIRALIPAKNSMRLEPDQEALLLAQGFAARRGPKPLINRDVFACLGDAIKACCHIKIDHVGENGSSKSHILAPYGVLYGKRPYLVAHTSTNGPELMKYFRLDKIIQAEVTTDYFKRDESFNLEQFSRKSYSIFQNEKEYGEVVWKFLPEAAEDAKSFIFHPDQTLKQKKDGSLIVSFMASGHLEMCWDLYRWGDKVQVLKPKALRDMCKNHRRNDFPGLP